MEGEIDNMNPCAFPLLFSPLQVGSMTVKNRIFMSAMSTALCDGQNQVTEDALAYYSARARGGVGLITLYSFLLWKGVIR